jgi:putative hemolysin
MNFYLAMLFWTVLALAGLLLSALFSGVETGIYRLNRIRLRLRSETGQPRARTLARLMRNQHSLLGTLLIGNNIANYLASSAIVALCSFTALAEWQIVVVVPIIMAPALMLFGEIIPKNIFSTYSDRYTYSFAGVLKVLRWMLLATGLLPLVDAVSSGLVRLTRRHVAGETDQVYHPRQQVGLLITESLHQGALSAYQSLLIDRVMNLRNVRVGQVMVPLPRVRATPAAITRDQFIAQARRHNHGRVLAYSDRPANAIGVIPVNAVLASEAPDRPIRDFVQPAPRLNADRTVVAALFTLQNASLGMGIVVDKSGKAVGIVTIRDLVEEIIGEIGDL